MSEAQNSVFIAALTGFFTIIGLVIGAVLEYWREKLQYDREKEKEHKETEKENNRNYLSPLFFHISENLSIPSIGSPKTFQELKNEFVSIKKLADEIEAIKELMKSNMHVLPMDVNLSLSYYVQSLRLFLDGLTGISDAVDKSKEEEKGMTVPKGFLEGLEELKTIYNDMNSTMAASIYTFMKFKKIPEKTVDFTGRTSEIKKVLDAMKASLISESEKSKEIES